MVGHSLFPNNLSSSNVAWAVELLPPQQLSLCLLAANFWPSSSPGACTTGTTCRRRERAWMPSFDAISIMLAMVLVLVLECFVCDERSGLCRVYVKYGANVQELKHKIGEKMKA